MRNNKRFNFIIIIVVAILFWGLGFWSGQVISSAKDLKNNLSIPLPKELLEEYRRADCQAAMNNAAYHDYEQYHKYYEKVVERIKQLELKDVEKAAILNYINGYEERQKQAHYAMFPREDYIPSEGGYGTKFGVDLPLALKEFDRHELLTYRMILTNMYDYIFKEDLDMIFSPN